MAEEKQVIQVKVDMDVLKAIRDLNSDYKEIPAVYIVDIALRHFLDELKEKKAKP